MKTNWPRVMSYSDSLGLTMDLDYAIAGDFNLFFQTALDVSMDEQLYLQECREHHHVQAIGTQTMVTRGASISEPTTMCMCALL